MNKVKLSELPIAKGVKTEVSLAVAGYKDCGVSKSGKPFIDLTVMDGDRLITGKAFDISCEQLESISVREGSVINAKVEVTDFNTRSYNFSDIRLESNDEKLLEQLVPMPPFDPEKMYEGIFKLIDIAAEDRKKRKGRTSGIGEFTKAFLDEYKSEYIKSSAALKMHHDLRGGLIYHSFRMSKAAVHISKVYDTLDPELLVSASAIHDIGKLRSMNTDPFGVASMTVDGTLFEHLLLGIELLNEFKAKYMGEVDDEAYRLLKHLIASHHGKMEFGAIKLPSVPEALALSMIDDLDAKMYMFEKNIEPLEQGEMTAKINILGTALYKALDN